MSPVSPAARNDHVVADQNPVFRFLSDPASHHLPPGEKVRRIDTHGAAVFLAGPFAYKVKRAVYFPFMDFSTLEKRKAACAAEIAISGANAPELYIGVVPITRDGDGYALGGAGEVVEYAVKMHRFDPADTLDQVASRQSLDRPLLTALAAAVAHAHDRAPVRRDHDVVPSLASYLADNRVVFAGQPDLFPPDQVSALASMAERELDRLTPLLRARADLGFVRRCHGDLHLANIVLLRGAPVLFDAIEFNDDIAICDVLYDLAFLVMDLWQRGLFAPANGVLNRYLWAQQQDDALDGLAALPFFLSLRAAIRAKVEAAGLAHLAGQEREHAARRIRRLFQTARLFLAPEPAPPEPRPLPPEVTTDFAGTPPTGLFSQARGLVAIGGLSGTGKTTRALRWGPFIGRAPGAVVLRSDVERKRLFGVPENAPLPEAAYAPQVTAQVYGRLRQLAARTLATGQSVIMDAVHARPDERADAEALAHAIGVPFYGLWLEAPLSVRVERVERRLTRRADASDADADVARQQQAYDLGSIDWRRLAAG
ncbi:bifunctional aminoglycoside phosphotransferase/ATP-binding protein [Xanthobacter agilis]|uniref:Aminoglycoside phosphotransferase family enzyme/predicted kinase n=1 Tax=Xanthobacter agilis TaxID=47492 RepID=A0ABU0LAF0_XANAG|nr:AAA family ATPase [Xanthobacter agilis]MDQ0504045.1 aminoglycoside phosphotransferase family enzyme/predicted kinase [Xanthobacter agilis]